MKLILRAFYHNYPHENILMLCVVVLLSACAPTIGSKIYADGQNSLNRRIAATYDKQVLRNLVRCKNGLFPYQMSFEKISGKGQSQITAGYNDSEDSFQTVAGSTLLRIDDAADSKWEAGIKLNDDFGGEVKVMSGINAGKILHAYHTYARTIDVEGPDVKPRPGALISVWLWMPEVNKKGFFSIVESDRDKFLKLQRTVFLPDVEFGPDHKPKKIPTKEPKEPEPIPVKIVKPKA